VKPIELNLLFTLLATIGVFFIGQALVSRVSLLKRFSIPAPVVGGGLVAVALAIMDGMFQIGFAFNLSMKDSLLLLFFSTVGLGADARMLAKGGAKLLIFLMISAVFIIIQNGIGMVASQVMDMHPAVGLLGGSITLTGGHGTGAAYAGQFVGSLNLQGAMELTMACATAGLVIGAVLGGPLAEYLIRRHKLEPAPQAVEATGEGPGGEPEDRITTVTLLNTLFVLFICLAGGKFLARLMEGTGFILPDFVFCLLIGVVIRNLSTFTKLYQLSANSVDTVGGVALSLFLVMALMTMKLLDLVNLAGPLLVILTAQTASMALYAVLVTFRVMGRNYDAAIIAAGHVGFGMSSTPCALAIMKAVTERHGLSPLAFLIVPMVGAFFIDILNALIIQGFLTLPFFGF